MVDIVKVVEALENAEVINGVIRMSTEFRDMLVALLKEQEEQIKQLEHGLAVTQNNLNYYLNGND